MEAFFHELLATLHAVSGNIESPSLRCSRHQPSAIRTGVQSRQKTSQRRQLRAGVLCVVLAVPPWGCLAACGPAAAPGWTPPPPLAPGASAGPAVAAAASPPRNLRSETPKSYSCKVLRELSDCAGRGSGTVCMCGTSMPSVWCAGDVDFGKPEQAAQDLRRRRPRSRSRILSPAPARGLLAHLQPCLPCVRAAIERLRGNTSHVCNARIHKNNTYSMPCWNPSATCCSSRFTVESKRSPIPSESIREESNHCTATVQRPG